MYVRKTVINSGLSSAFEIDVVQELPVCRLLCSVHHPPNIQFDSHTKTVCVTFPTEIETYIHMQTGGYKIKIHIFKRKVRKQLFTF